MTTEYALTVVGPGLKLPRFHRTVVFQRIPEAEQTLEAEQILVHPEALED
jgi:hypothetical protein